MGGSETNPFTLTPSPSPSPLNSMKESTHYRRVEFLWAYSFNLENSFQKQEKKLKKVGILVLVNYACINYFLFIV